MLKESFSKDKILKKFQNGISNDTYLLENNIVYRHKVIYRDGLMNDLKNEATFLKMTPTFPYHEKIISLDDYANEKYSVYIPYTRSFKKEEKDYKIIIQYIKDLHNLKIAFSYKFPLFAYLEKNQLAIAQFIEIKQYEKILHQVKKLYKKYPLVISHNDLVNNNILFENNYLYVIDYEYVALNIELFDIASFLSENNLDDEKTKLYFLMMFENKYQLEELSTMILIEDILWAIWAKKRYDDTKKDIYRIIYQEKVKRVKKNEHIIS